MKDIRRFRQAPTLDVLRGEVHCADGANGGESGNRSSAGGIVRGGRSCSSSFRKNIRCGRLDGRRQLPSKGLSGNLLADGLADHCC